MILWIGVGGVIGALGLAAIVFVLSLISDPHEYWGEIDDEG